MINEESEGLKRFKNALEKYDMDCSENLSVWQKDIGVSKKHLRRMKKILKRTKPPCVSWKRIACTAVVVLLVFGSFMSVSAVREPIVRFFVNTYQNFIEIFFEYKGTAVGPRTIETFYILHYVPEGYILYQRTMLKLQNTTLWKNEESDLILLSQYTPDEKYTFDTAHSNFRLLNLSDMEIMRMETHDRKIFFWHSDGYAFKLTVPNTISDEECQAMIFSLSIAQE